MTRIRSLLVAFLAIAAVGCTSGPSIPDSDAHISGTLTEFLEAPARPATARMIVQRQDLPSPDGRAIVHVESGTDIYLRQPDGALRPANVGDLATGDLLQVWTTGIELRSYPPQVFAVRIHILR